jgi:hypothetical protein
VHLSDEFVEVLDPMTRVITTYLAHKDPASAHGDRVEDKRKRDRNRRAVRQLDEGRSMNGIMVEEPRLEGLLPKLAVYSSGVANSWP